MTGAELGRLVDSDKSQISRWKTGLARPEPETVTRIADLFGVDRVTLLEMAGYLPSQAPASIDAERQARVAQLDRWLIAVGEPNEQAFWAFLKAQGDSAVSLFQTLGTAVNAADRAAVNAAVSAPSMVKTPRRRGVGRRLSRAQHPAKTVLGTPRFPHNHPSADLTAPRPAIVERR
jgi:transcriptional regulator with XRE-family HTH domain